MKNTFTTFLISFFYLTAFGQDIQLIEYATGFSSPVDITNAGDDRLFVVERSGRIKIIDGSGNVLSTNFLDIDSKVFNSGFQDERGLLGLAFHPDYANNGYFFVNYVDNGGSSIIERYSVDASNPNLADATSGTNIMTIEQPAGNHNGGCIKFGADGYLYIGMGDGGSGDDPWNNAQNPQELLGKMLRIDIDNGLPYTVPADNPFVNDNSVLDEIWAIGLRNPWRFSFDRETGDLWIGDVGQNAWEEIDFQPASSSGGENYGWRCQEGNHVNNGVSQNGCGSASDYTPPVFEVQHPAGFGGPCSVTGGFVYRGTQNPDMVGKYFFADYCSGDFFSVAPDGAGGWVGQEIFDSNYDISTFGEDADGELYVARLGNGRVYQVVSDACASLMLSVNVTNQPCEGNTDGTAEVTGAGGTPPYTFSPTLDLNNLAGGNYNITITDDIGCATSTTFAVNALPLPSQPTVTVNDNLLTAPAGFSSYQWLLDGQPIAGATNETYTINESGNYSVEVTNANGCSNTSDDTNVTFTSLAAIPALEGLRITPNPFAKAILLEIVVNDLVKLNVEILDLNGKSVFSQEIRVNDKFTQSIDLEALSAGVYSLNIRSEAGVVTKKIIKN
ncbi:MAG: PQQ-dependent sugar dehydrogenase [Bacteroidota bacterium]